MSVVREMMRRNALATTLIALALGGAASACGRSAVLVVPRTPPEVSAQLPPQLPVLPAEDLVVERSAPPVLAKEERRVSVRAIDADARSLLIGVANQAGIDMIVASDVERRISLTLTDVPASVAIAEIVSAAGLTIATPPRPMPSVVFYQLPVNINAESAETIAARFDVSLELARFIVESRKPFTP